MKSKAWIGGAMSVLVAALFAAAGCMVGPDYHAPDTRSPARFNAVSHPTTQVAATQPLVPVDLTRWWETFNDPHLNRLIAEGMRSSLDLRLAEARVREARAELAFNRAGLFPTLDSSASYARSRSSKSAFAVGGTTGPGGTGGTTAGSGGGTSGGSGGGTTGGASGGTTGSTTGSAPFAFAIGETNLYQAGFDAGWEIDVFGGTRRAIEAATYTVEAQVDGRRNAMVTLLSEVARNYIALRGLQHELAIVRNNVAAQRDTLDLTVSRFRAGIATDLNVAQAEAQVTTTQSQIPTLETQIQQAIHRLAVLLNRDVDSLEAELGPDAALPVGPAQIPPGLPSELIRRRPDVRQAERALAAANANIGVAVAELFPKFSLTGSVGLESLRLKSFTNSASVFYSYGPQVAWRILDAGQIWANVRVQNARQQQALIQYQQSVIQAFADVEDALTAYNQEQARRRTLEQSVESNRRAVQLSIQLNNAGVVDFLNVLTAQLSLYQSEDQLAQSQQTVSTDLVALYKALGGGWEVAEQEQPAQPRQQSADAQ